jgi:hypothetical protein
MSRAYDPSMSTGHRGRAPNRLAGADSREDTVRATVIENFNLGDNPCSSAEASAGARRHRSALPMSSLARLAVPTDPDRLI